VLNPNLHGDCESNKNNFFLFYFKKKKNKFLFTKIINSCHFTFKPEFKIQFGYYKKNTIS